MSDSPPLSPPPSKLDEVCAALVCLQGAAMVAIAAGPDGKNAYKDLRKLLGDINLILQTM